MAHMVHMVLTLGLTQRQKTGPRTLAPQPTLLCRSAAHARTHPRAHGLRHMAVPPPTPLMQGTLGAAPHGSHPAASGSHGRRGGGNWFTTAAARLSNGGHWKSASALARHGSLDDMVQVGGGGVGAAWECACGCVRAHDHHVLPVCVLVLCVCMCESGTMEKQVCMHLCVSVCVCVHAWQRPPHHVPPPQPALHLFPIRTLVIALHPYPHPHLDRNSLHPSPFTLHPSPCTLHLSPSP